LARLGTVVDLTGIVTEQQIVVGQTRCVQDEEHDALDAALLADIQATVLHEGQKKVYKSCQNAIAAAHDAFDVALANLEEAHTLFQSPAAAVDVTGVLI